MPRLELNWSSWDLMWLKFRCLSHIRIQEEDKQKLDQSRGNYNQITQLILYCLVLQWDCTCNIQGVSLKWQQVNWTSSPSSLKWSYLSYMHLFANLQWYLWHLNIQTWKLKNGCHPNMGLYICISYIFVFVFLYLHLSGQWQYCILRPWLWLCLPLPTHWNLHARHANKKYHNFTWK